MRGPRPVPARPVLDVPDARAACGTVAGTGRGQRLGLTVSTAFGLVLCFWLAAPTASGLLSQDA
jgi:hypothetical protein